MDNRYKVIISSKNIYKEIELSPEDTKITIGTGIECDIRIRKDLFFGNIELKFYKSEDSWNLVCSDNLYLTTGDIRRLMTKTMDHGDSLEVRYQESDIEVFKILFTLDFEYEQKYYDVEIDISGKDRLVFGGKPNADIHIIDEYVGTDTFFLSKENGKTYIIDENTQYGVYVNGSKIDNRMEIKDYDFFSIASFSFYYKKGKLYTDGNSKLTLHQLSSRKLDYHTTHFKYPDFIRSTRVEYCIPEAELEIKQPLPKPQKPKKRLLLSIIPAVVMLALVVVMRGILGGGGSFVIYSACSMAIGIVMSIVTYFYDGKEYKEEVEKREKAYREYIGKKEEEVIAARANELRIRRLIHESLENSIQEVMTFGKRIYEKAEQDKDFLDVYLGTGTIEANVPIKFTKQEFVDAEDEISMLPEELEKRYKYIENAPIVCKFNSSKGVGVVGGREQLRAILKNITLDLAIRHCYKEVKLYYVFGDHDYESMKWTRWLRHSFNDDIGIRNFMCDDESRKILLENLYTILSEREALKKESETVAFENHYVVFVMDATALRKHPVSKYIEECDKYGFTFVFFEEYEEFLPRGCTNIIRLDNNSRDNRGVVLGSDNGDFQTKFSFDSVSNETAESVALKLGAVTIEDVSLESELTNSISMYELLNIITVDDLDLKKRWSESQVFRSMAAPLGVKTKNEVVYLDISDKANGHGPHGLVAGTTGSGKSEILQTYVLAMATLFHPYEVGFVIIDFKGGGMANQFKDLPHMMGAITNIDGREIDRSLLSIKAELVKRQSLFAEAGVNHINDYIKLYKKGAVDQPLPHLIIIVDEFAELKAEFPDFMKELISAARIGRTLGVHLILATQKPAGVVDSQIWSNSKFKLCLKVQTKEDSSEVIKTPLAAEIVEPGRAYFQVGNNEIFELFQSAYSGVKVTDNGNDKTEGFSIYALNEWGKRELVYTNKRNAKDDDAKNQLQVIVDYIQEYCSSARIKQLSGICLPSLPDVLTHTELNVFKKVVGENIVIPVGLYDDPARQSQGNYSVDMSESNTYIVGAAMTGKTTLLQTMLLQLMKLYTPEEVNVYIIDCGNMALKAFEHSDLVGGVAIAAEEEKVTNLFKMIFRCMEERKKVFAEKGLGTHKAYREAGYKDHPQIVLMIDNLAAFREYYDNLSDDFLSLSREANSLGISIVATANQTNAMHYKALSNYATRIALVCNDTNEYMNLFDRCRMVPKDTEGRGLCLMDKRILEFQTALCVEGDKEYIRVENIRKEIARCNQAYDGGKAMSIPVVPETLVFDTVKSEGMYRNNYKIPMGVNYETVQYEMLDLLNVGLLATLGKEKFGKSNFIKHIFKAIQSNIFGTLTEAYVVDGPDQSMSEMKQYGFVEKYTTDIHDLEFILERLEMMLTERQEQCMDRGIEYLDEEPLLLLVIENERLQDLLQTEKALSAKFVQLIKQFKKYKFAVILSAIENMAVPFSAPEFIKFIKDNKKFIVFDDLANVKFFDISVKQVKENAKELELGDAFSCIGNSISRMKTIHVKDGE